MKKSIRVLIVEDSEVDAELMLHTLEDHGFTPETQRVETEASYLQCLEHTPDIILADYRLPRFSGPRALELLKAQALDIPFIVVSGNISDVEAAELIKSGACDFLIKDRMARLGSAVEQALDAKCARDEKRRVEQELAESENKFRLICETVADVVVLVDGDGRMQYANPAIGHVFGYTPGETEGKSIEMLQPVRLREKYRKGVNRFLESHEELHNWGGVERIGRHSDGHEFPIEIRYSKLSLHGKQGFVGVIHDITNRKQAEEALYTSKEIIERIINTIPMRVFWKDKNHVFLGCNDEFAHDAGFSESGEVIGKDDYQM
ncbi:MAG TPA: PAS domain S-box protein, partial [Candidatus Kapabacteria bacterium]|nr:PAS domain S-box protein [Candidatus Kapabacteria bacterium]